MNRISQRFLGAFAVTTLAGTLIAGGLAATASNQRENAKPGVEIIERVAPSPLQSFAPVVKLVAPSVAQITTLATTKTTDFREDMMQNPMFRFFYGPGAEGMPGRVPRSQVQKGAGSAVIVSKDGYLLTNNHVVDGADKVQVKLHDGREFEAKVVGRDPQTDVAVIKIDADGLPAIAVANSDLVEVGDLVLAVGNPFNIGQTVTSGIVSAKGRATLGLDYEDFIQTDAAINKGNSGGALVDSQGRLIGINTAILSATGGNQGIGFAIPVNLARSVMDDLVKDGRVTRSYIGVLIQDLTPALAKQFELKEAKGALVGEVKAGGPAANAGIESGDVIVEFAGKEVTDSRHLKFTVAAEKPGSTVPVKVIRDGKAKTLKLKLQELDASKGLAGAFHDQGTLNGVTVGDLDARTRRQFGVPSGIEGVVVTEVEPDSPAYERGLRPGDVILEINRKEVKSADEAVALTEKPENKTTLLRVWSKNGSRYIVVDESETN